MRHSIASGTEQVSTRTWSTRTVQEATQGVPATIRCQRSSIATTRSSWNARCCRARKGLVAGVTATLVAGSDYSDSPALPSEPIPLSLVDEAESTFGCT